MGGETTQPLSAGRSAGHPSKVLVAGGKDLAAALQLTPSQTEKLNARLEVGPSGNTRMHAPPPPVVSARAFHTVRAVCFLRVVPSHDVRPPLAWPQEHKVSVASL